MLLNKLSVFADFLQYSVFHKQLFKVKRVEQYYMPNCLLCQLPKSEQKLQQPKKLSLTLLFLLVKLDDLMPY